MNQTYAWLRECILRDLSVIGINTRIFNLIIKDYSKKWDGVYRPRTNNIHIYYYKDLDEDTGMYTVYTYKEYMETAIHEACHAIQYHSKDFVRKKGVMHDEAFWKMCNHFTEVFRNLYEWRQGQKVEIPEYVKVNELASIQSELLTDSEYPAELYSETAALRKYRERRKCRNSKLQ